MNDLQLEDLEINELKKELDFIQDYNDLPFDCTILTDDGLVSGNDYRLSTQYKKKIQDLYNKKIKEERKKSFTLINGHN